MSFGFLLGGIASALCLFLLPEPALAWGPIAHLDFAIELLEKSVALSPSILMLIRAHRHDFLWGTLAADTIVGKNRAKEHDHCHGWDVARRLLIAAAQEGDARRAMMLGYFAHLGADVVAHNHIVPQMLVTHFRSKGVGHLYWEVRADHRLLELSPRLEVVWRDLVSRRFHEHDAFLARQLVPTLFSNSVSARIWKESMRLQRRGPWRRFVRSLDRRSHLLFEQADLLRWRTLSVEAARKAVDNPFGRRLAQLDPIGREALAQASSRRKALRRSFALARKKGDDGAHQIAHAAALRKTLEVDIAMFEDD